MKRNIEPKIKDWLNNSKSALLISGARQVGKTYIIRKILQDANCDYVEINLIENEELVSAIDSAKLVDDLMVTITASMNHKLIPGQTIIFIDEVQKLIDLVTRIKFWVDDGRFRYILSGSLLGVEMRNLRSVPVGYLQEIEMYPMDFEEFLIASGVQDETIDYLKTKFKECKPVGEAVHQVMMKHFYRYLVVGGMPEAVSMYVENGDMNAVSTIQKNIINQYKKDFTKYEDDNKKLFLQDIYNTVPANLLKQNKRFNYNDIKKGLHYDKTENSFLWLTSAGVVIPTYNATEPRLSLSQNKKSSLLKLYSSDVGLLTYQYGNATRLQILSQNDKINLGGVFENAVAQQLNAHGFDTFFYNSHKLGELDFVIEYNLHVVPIEVKSGKDYYVHSAINNVLANSEYEIEKAYVFANCDVSVEGKIVYMPVYMCSFIEDDVKMPVLEKIENY